MPELVRYQDSTVIAVKGPITRKILAHGPSLMTVEVSFSEAFVDVPHSHFHDQICVILEGMFELNLNGEMIRMTPGDSIFLPGNVPHCANSLTPGKLLDIFNPRRDDFLK